MTDSTEAEPDAELERLAVAARSDPASLERLIRQDYDRLYAVCRRLLGDPERARDAAQEAALSVARHIASFDRRSRYTTWSYRIAVNTSLDELRRERRRPVVLAEEAMDGPQTSAVPLETSVTDRLSVTEALTTLPAEQAEALRLRHFLGLDYAEIASLLGVPIGTVRSRLSRGRLALARLLRPDDAAGGNEPPARAVEVERKP